MLWQDDALAIGGLAGLVFLIALIIFYRWRCFTRKRLTWPQIFMAATIGGLSVYHIVWVVWGQGRTGWP